MRNRHSTLCFEINFEIFAIEMIADFSTTSHVELIVLFERNEQMSENFWTEIFWCSDSNVWKDKDDRDKVVNH